MINAKDLKTGFDKLLSTETLIRRQKRTEKNKKKNLFISLIKKYDEALLKSILLQSQFSIDLSKYEDPFYNIIDELILLSWGENIYQLISFYFYERINENGEEQCIIGPEGEEIFIKTPEQLYDVIQKLYPKTFE